MFQLVMAHLYRGYLWCAGGSALATDEIWDEVLRVKASGKRVIASMGNMAASAGYEVAGQALCHSLIVAFL